MQLPIIAHRGQVKPYGSIPRINWAHSLTNGLISYCYDVGSGPIDLVTGNQCVIANSANPPFGGPRSTKYGSALSSVAAVSSVNPGLYTVPGNDNINNLIVAAPYSFGCGLTLFATDTAFANLFGTCDSTSNPPVMIGCANAGTDFWFRINNGTINATATGVQSVGSFQSLLGVATSGTAYNGYLDGILRITPAVTTTAVAATVRPAFHGTRNQAAQSTTSSVIFYGALWKGRALTASEARLLHDDPYCFLIYPEDEMFASLVAAAAVAGSGNPVFGISQDDGRTFTQMVGY